MEYTNYHQIANTKYNGVPYSYHNMIPSNFHDNVDIINFDISNFNDISIMDSFEFDPNDTLEALQIIQELDDQSSISQPSSDHTDHTDQSIQEIKKKRSRRSEEANQRRNMRRRAHPFPRLIKRDPRRDYASMFMNVVNSGDFNLQEKYLTKFYSPYCHFSQSTSAEIMKCMKPVYYQAQGLQSVLQFFKALSECTPDFVFSLSDTQIRVDPLTKRSILIAKTKLTGTKIKAREKDYFSMFLKMLEFRRKNNLPMITSPLDERGVPVTAKFVDLEEEILETRIDNTLKLFYDPTSEGSLTSSFDDSIDSIDNSDMSSISSMSSGMSSGATSNSDNTPRNKQHSCTKHKVPDNSDSPDNPIIVFNPPLKTSVSGFITMHLDPDFIITKLEMMKLESSMILEPVLVA